MLALFFVSSLLPGLSGYAENVVSEPEDTQENAIYMFDNLATRSGTQTPDRTIAGDETMLDGPFAISIFDQ